jgi:hypothetical protein
MGCSFFVPHRSVHFEHYGDSGSKGHADQLIELHFCNFPGFHPPGFAKTPHFSPDRISIRIRQQNSKLPDQSPAPITGMVIDTTPVLSFHERSI